jgi:hypothetical protein
MSKDLTFAIVLEDNTLTDLTTRLVGELVTMGLITDYNFSETETEIEAHNVIMDFLQNEISVLKAQTDE